MPTQKFAPMTKNFATFDCDAHVTEPPWLWERAKDWLTSAELEALKDTMWFDAESKQLIVNGFAGAGLGSQRIGGTITVGPERPPVRGRLGLPTSRGCLRQHPNGNRLAQRRAVWTGTTHSARPPGFGIWASPGSFTVAANRIRPVGVSFLYSL